MEALKNQYEEQIEHLKGELEDKHSSDDPGGGGSRTGRGRGTQRGGGEEGPHNTADQVGYLPNFNFPSLLINVMSIIRFFEFTSKEFSAWAFKVRPNTAQIYRLSVAVSDCYSNYVLPDQLHPWFDAQALKGIYRVS